MVIDTGINYNLTAGTSVGLQPTYQWNAKVTSGTIQIYDAEGNAVADSYTSEGDHITILSICPSEYTQLSLALIQFPDQSNSCYIQGYIQTSDFNLLECRFNNSWVDTTNNQQIIFANGDLADRTLNAGDYQTYLYATDNYACISFLNDDNAFKSGFVPLSSGNLNIIQTDIPFYLAPGSSVGTEPSYPSNATTIASQIEIVDINGITIPNNYTSNGDNITILDVYMNEKLALIEFPDSYAGTYIIGYIPVENLINGNIKLKSNYCNWNSSTKEYSIYDLQKSVIYKIESSQTTEYLFKTNAYACILFNNNNVSQWPLETGFVSLGDGSFGLGTSSKKANNSLPSGINMNLQTGFSTLNASINIINSFSDINGTEQVPSYIELSNGIDGCTVLNSSGELENNSTVDILNTIYNSATLMPGFYHHLYDPKYVKNSMSCIEQGVTFAKALINNNVGSTHYAFALQINEESFNNSASVPMEEIVQCASDFMNGLESTITGKFTVMLYTSLNMINNVSTPPLYESSLTNSMLWMDSYLSEVTDSTYEPTNSQIVSAFYEMNSISWGGKTGWSVWGYENSNDITSCIANLYAIYDSEMYYNPIESETTGGSNTGSSDQPINNFVKGDVVKIKESAQYFAVGSPIDSLNNDTFQIKKLIDINTGSSSQNGYVVVDCSNHEEFNVYTNQVQKINK